MWVKHRRMGYLVSNVMVMFMMLLVVFGGSFVNVEASQSPAPPTSPAPPLLALSGKNITVISGKEIATSTAYFFAVYTQGSSNTAKENHVLHFKNCDIKHVVYFRSNVVEEVKDETSGETTKKKLNILRGVTILFTNCKFSQTAFKLSFPNEVRDVDINFEFCTIHSYPLVYFSETAYKAQDVTVKVQHSKMEWGQGNYNVGLVSIQERSSPSVKVNSTTIVVQNISGLVVPAISVFSSYVTNSVFQILDCPRSTSQRRLFYGSLSNNQNSANNDLIVRGNTLVVNVRTFLVYVYKVNFRNIIVENNDFKMSASQSKMVVISQSRPSQSGPSTVVIRNNTMAVLCKSYQTATAIQWEYSSPLGSMLDGSQFLIDDNRLTVTAHSLGTVIKFLYVKMVGSSSVVSISGNVIDLQTVGQKATGITFDTSEFYNCGVQIVGNKALFKGHSVVHGLFFRKTKLNAVHFTADRNNVEVTSPGQTANMFTFNEQTQIIGTTFDVKNGAFSISGHSKADFVETHDTHFKNTALRVLNNTVDIAVAGAVANFFHVNKKFDVAAFLTSTLYFANNHITMKGHSELDGWEFTAAGGVTSCRIILYKNTMTYTKIVGSKNRMIWINKMSKSHFEASENTFLLNSDSSENRLFRANDWIDDGSQIDILKNKMTVNAGTNSFAVSVSISTTKNVSWTIHDNEMVINSAGYSNSGAIAITWNTGAVRPFFLDIRRNKIDIEASYAKAMQLGATAPTTVPRQNAITVSDNNVNMKLTQTTASYGLLFVGPVVASDVTIARNTFTSNQPLGNGAISFFSNAVNCEIGLDTNLFKVEEGSALVKTSFRLPVPSNTIWQRNCFGNGAGVEPPQGFAVLPTTSMWNKDPKKPEVKSCACILRSNCDDHFATKVVGDKAPICSCQCRDEEPLRSPLFAPLQLERLTSPSWNPPTFQFNTLDCSLAVVPPFPLETPTQEQTPSLPSTPTRTVSDSVGTPTASSVPTPSTTVSLIPPPTFTHQATPTHTNSATISKSHATETHSHGTPTILPTSTQTRSQSVSDDPELIQPRVYLDSAAISVSESTIHSSGFQIRLAVTNCDFRCGDITPAMISAAVSISTDEETNQAEKLVDRASQFSVASCNPTTFLAINVAPVSSFDISTAVNGSITINPRSFVQPPSVVPAGMAFDPNTLDTNILPLEVGFSVEDDVHPPAVQVPKQVVDSAKTSAAVGSIAASAAGNPAVATQAARTAVILDLLECKNSRNESLDWIQSPTGFVLGDESDETRFLAGACLMNPVIMAGFAVLHLVVAFAVQQHKNGKLQERLRGGGASAEEIERELLSYNDALSKVRFPALQLVVILPLLEPTMSALTTVLRYSNNAVGLAIAAIDLIGATSFAVWMLWLTLFRFRAKFQRDDERGEERSAVHGFIIGRGEWTDDADGDQFVNRYFMFFDLYAPRVQWFGVVELVLTMVLGVIDGWEPANKAGCQASVVVAFLLFLAFFVALCVLRPYVAKFNAVVSGGVALMQMLSSCAAVGFMFTSNDKAVDIAGWTATGAMYFLTLKAVADMVLTLWGLNIQKWWANRNQGEVERRMAEKNKAIMKKLPKRSDKPAKSKSTSGGVLHQPLLDDSENQQVEDANSEAYEDPEYSPEDDEDEEMVEVAAHNPLAEDGYNDDEDELQGE